MNAISQIPQNATNMQIKNLGGRVGSYAISTVDIDSWANQPVVQAPQRIRKTRGVKEVIHKVFADCAMWIDESIHDPFWVEKFNTAATGKFPRGFSYSDGVLLYRKGAKCHTLDVPNNPYEAAHACMEFFRSNGGIFSTMDQQDSMELQYARSQAVLTQQQLTWGDANKKIQECMLSHYVIGMKSIMNLSDHEVEQLRQTIKLGIANKFFGKHNIHVDNNRVHSIDGLLWNNEKRNFYINPDLKPNTTRSYSRNKDGPPAVDPSQKDTIPQFGLKWNKYIENIDKKIARNNRRVRRVTVNHPGLTQGQVRHLQLVTTSGSTTANSLTEPTTGEETADDDDEDEE
ncbi:Hypothetical protein HVR_LOCUS1176 [uncultured virus]|nr:Hypothetical protein HVR_LOCUS1176 [uncultured virus]